jgi:hypothetical protein
VREASRSQLFTLPKTPGSMRSTLNNLKPNLRRAGIEVVFARVRQGKLGELSPTWHGGVARAPQRGTPIA